MSNRRLALTLFTCLYAAQAAFLSVGSVLPEIAHAFGAHTATAGQLRAVSGLAGAATAIVLVAGGSRLGVHRLLVAGLGLIAASSVFSAAAPSLVALAAAQAACGVGATLVLAAGVAATAQWADAENRTRVLAWALVGQPAAWVVGMPSIGLLATVSWRCVFVLPLAGAGLALWLMPRRRTPSPADTRPSGALRLLAGDRRLLAWALSELLAYSAWAGVLIYVPALMIEAHGASPVTSGLLLGIAALAYFPSNFGASRLVGRHARQLLVGINLALGLVAAALGSVAGTTTACAALFAGCVFLAGGRTISGSALGLTLAPSEHAVAVSSIRTAAAQIGNFIGAALGGLALAAGGYELAFIGFGGLFALAATPHLAAAGRATYPATTEHQGASSRLLPTPQPH
jgi:predicted MFS family arabinose efflux permease